MEGSLTIAITRFLPALQAAIESADQSETRPVLHAVLLDIDNEGMARLIGADNYVITVAELYHEPTALRDAQYVIRLDDAKLLAKALRAIPASRRQYLSLTLEPDGQGLDARFNGQAVVLGLVEGEYPHWRKIALRSDHLRFRFALDPALMERAAKAARVLGSNNVRVYAGHPTEQVALAVMDANGSPVAQTIVMPKLVAEPKLVRYRDDERLGKQPVKEPVS